jgi:hypothetical protein
MCKRNILENFAEIRRIGNVLRSESLLKQAAAAPVIAAARFNPCDGECENACGVFYGPICDDLFQSS